MKNILYCIAKFFIKLSNRYSYTYQVNGVISGEVIESYFPNNKKIESIIIDKPESCIINYDKK